MEIEPMGITLDNGLVDEAMEYTMADVFIMLAELAQMASEEQWKDGLLAARECMRDSIRHLEKFEESALPAGIAMLAATISWFTTFLNATNMMQLNQELRDMDISFLEDDEDAH